MAHDHGTPLFLLNLLHSHDIISLQRAYSLILRWWTGKKFSGPNYGNSQKAVFFSLGLCPLSVIPRTIHMKQKLTHSQIPSLSACSV